MQNRALRLGNAKRRAEGGSSVTTSAATAVTVNGTPYRWPRKPVVAVCIDGGDPAYFEHGLAHGYVPNVARFMRQGFSAIARGTVPSVTCTNNMSIVTGAPASVHGISGNFYLDPASGEAVVMTGPELLRGETVFERFAAAGARIAAITAKDKLRRQLGKGLHLARGNICFSSECADSCSVAEHGIERVLERVGMPKPDMYSMELSLFVLEAGVRILARERPDILYLSLTDWVQHKYAPGEPEAVEFYRKLDHCFGRLAEHDVILALTADHGMNDKSRADGSPNVIWLQDILDAELGAGATRVICPITDHFIAHHGALGSFVRVYCRGAGATPASIMRVLEPIAGLTGIYDRATVCSRFDLPPDREGDVAVVSARDVCIGAAEREHDLTGLHGHRLRSHGGVTEARVPFVLSEPLSEDYSRQAQARPLDSYRLFDFAINGTP
ncbi:MAG: phosphonoacetate hydrolase [Burkholderiales bacterium]|nr:phosphonoacetate hydrolase [Burkholderiales bacterium]